MHKKLENILEKYAHIEFSYREDKELFLDFLRVVSLDVGKRDIGKLNDLAQILEYYFLEYSQFDAKILYNPVELINSLIEKDFFGKKIDDGEYNHILKELKFFRDYVQGKLEEKDFLEKKYGINIVCVTSDVGIYPIGIYARGLSGISKLSIIKKIKKLIDFYPINFIKNIKLDSIIVVKTFYKKDVFGKRIYLGGFETDGDDNIYLTESNLTDAFDHELYHQAMQRYDDFQKWREIREDQDKKYLHKNIDVESQGFARNYGKENISEDQATIAEDLVCNYDYLIKRSLTDRKLSQKINLVKNAYYKLSDGVMSENWWESKKDIILEEII